MKSILWARVYLSSAMSLVALFFCDFSAALESRISVSVGGLQLSIPQTYIDAPSSGEIALFQSHGGDGSKDVDGEVSVVFPANDLAEHISGYNVMDGTFPGDVRAYIVSSPRRRLPHDSEPVRAWSGVDDYEDRVSEWDGSFYRIYSSENIRGMWLLFSTEIYSFNFDQIDKYYIGQCYSEMSRRTRSGKLERCFVTMHINNLNIKLTIYGDNIKFLHFIEEFVTGKINEWMKK